MSDLKKIFGAHKKITIAEDFEVVVKTFPLSEVPNITDVIEKLVRLYPEYKKDEMAAIFRFLKDDFDSVFKLLKATTNLDSETLGSLDAESFVVIIAEVIQVNSAFLSAKVLPAVKAATEKVSNLVGSIPSKNLSAEGTELKK